MSITFALIPTSKKYEAFAHEVEKKIKRVIHCEIIFDNDYENIMTNKLAYYKSQEIDVITIGLNNKISVRFVESFRRPQIMDLNELIECLKSYVDALNTENDYYHQNKNQYDDDNDSDSDNDYEKRENNIKNKKQSTRQTIQSKKQTNQTKKSNEEENDNNDDNDNDDNERQNQKRGNSEEDDNNDEDTISCIIL